MPLSTKTGINRIHLTAQTSPFIAEHSFRILQRHSSLTRYNASNHKYSIVNGIVSLFVSLLTLYILYLFMCLLTLYVLSSYNIFAILHST